VSDYETTERKRNVSVGIFVLIGICAIVWLIFKFGDMPVFVSRWKSFEIRVQFPTAPGVQENTPVRFCGYQIGRVVKVNPPKMLKEVKGNRRYHQTVVVVNIDKKYDDIPSGVEAKLMTRGLGSSYIEFKVTPPDDNEPITDFLENGSVLQGSTGMTSEFFPEESQQKLDDLANNLIDLIDNANAILGDTSNRKNLKAILANMTEVTKQATESLEEFRRFFVAGTEAGEELSKTVSQLRLVAEKINEGRGSAGQFINDGRLYENLLENTEQLQLLLEEARQFIAEYRQGGVKVKL